MEIDGEKNEANTAWNVADIEGLTIQGKQMDGILALMAEGRVDGRNALEFQNALGALSVDNLTGLVLDLEHLSYISSAGLRVILLIGHQLQGRAVKFSVCSLQESIREVFQVSGFDKIISAHATRVGALSAFGE